MAQFLAILKAFSSLLPFLKRERTIRKLLYTGFYLFLYRVGNSIPLDNIDSEALEKSFENFSTGNTFLQSLSILSNGKILITAFTLGVIPSINASLVVDFFTTIFPRLEKLKSEEGTQGKKKLLLYKKIGSFFFAVIQAIGVTTYLRPYLFVNSPESNFFLGLELVAGAMTVLWICQLIDINGIGNGTSLILLTNIFTSAFLKLQVLFQGEVLKFSLFVELPAFYFLILLISFCQSRSEKIPIVSARQLSYLQAKEVKQKDIARSYLPLKLTQAGVFPIILASNLSPFLSYFLSFFFGQSVYLLEKLWYYFLIIIFNYFYTFFFWDPQKISEELRKQSVIIPGVTPGKATEKYLSQKVTSTSLRGGVALCAILFLVESFKSFSGFSFLTALNSTSLLIGLGILSEVTRSLKADSVFRFFSFFSKRSFS
jgi:preprotein translocase subunit SecY